MKVAVIGCGTIAAAQHIPAYDKLENTEIKYFCDIIPQRAQAMAEKYGYGEAVTDYRTVLEDPEVEAVSVCTPNHMHRDIAIAFLEAGKHVLCEKPAARTYEEALEMQQAQKNTGKILNIGVVNRFNTAVNRIRHMAEEGTLGEVYHVYASFRSHRCIPGLGGAFTTKSISGGGVLIDWGVHFLDLIMYCVGDPKPLTVSGKAYSRLGCDIEDYTYVDMWAGPPVKDGVYDVEDFITGFIRTQGPTITLNGAWAQNIGKDEMFIDFLGDRAGVRLSYCGNYTLYSVKDGALLETVPSYQMEQPYEKEVAEFIRCIETGEKLPSHIDYALQTAKMMQALYDSSEQGKEVVLG